MNPHSEKMLTLAAMWVLSFFLLGLIWYSTSLPGKDLPRENDTIGLISSSMGHFIGFGLFSACLYSALRIRQLTGRFVIVLIVGSILAITTEVHQRSIPGRDADIIDVILDLLGSTVGTVGAYKYWLLSQGG